MAGPIQTKAPARIEVRSVSIARYLDRPQVVRSTSNNQVAIGGNERWGDPLGSMVSRIVAENLGQRLPKAIVFNGDSALSVTPNALVEIDIQRMDLDHSGSVVLAAQVAVSRGINGTPTVKTLRYEVRRAGLDGHEGSRPRHEHGPRPVVGCHRADAGLTAPPSAALGPDRP